MRKFLKEYNIVQESDIFSLINPSQAQCHEIMRSIKRMVKEG